MVRKVLQYVLLALILLLVFLGSAVLAMRFAIHGREVRVPKLAGLTPAEAERTANASGLVLSVENRFYSATIPQGRIVSQSPPADASVRRGWKVLVAESLGPQSSAIPNLIGQSEHAAEINLGRRGMEIGSVATIHLPDVPPQTVVAQSPPADATDATSPRIALVLSAADNSQSYVMPSFTGKPLAAAAAAVQQAGLTLGGKWGAIAAASKTAKDKSAIPELTGTVVKQYPLAGQKVSTGTAVYFEVKH